MELREIVWDGVDWIHLAQYRDQWWVPVNMVIESSGSIKVGEFLHYY
jgi:hypothetical protein